MASSLLFRIKSIFDSTGFREAQSGFTGLLRTLSGLTMATAKSVLTFKNLGAAAAYVGLTFAGSAIKSMLVVTKTSVEAEQATFRLRNQLNLLGKGSQENVTQVLKFAQTTARATRYATDQTEEAVALALRHTKDVGAAIKEVSTAQDVASGTGVDLIRTTQAVIQAQNEMSRALRSITQLRLVDIDSAVREGKLLDVLASKFGGSASREASTYAGKLQILNNINKQSEEEWNRLGLGLGKLILTIQIFGANIKRNAIDIFPSMIRFIGDTNKALQSGDRFYYNYADSMLHGKIALGGFIEAVHKTISQLNQQGEAASKAASNFQFKYNRQLELNTELLGKSADERRRILAEYLRSDALIALAQQREGQGARELSAEQIEFLKKRQFYSEALTHIIQTQTDAEKESAQKIAIEAAKIRNAPVESPGILGAIKRANEYADALKKAGVDVKTIRAEWTAMLQKAGVPSTITRQLLAYPELSKKLSQVAEAIIKPAFDIKIGFNIPPEALKEAVAIAVRSFLPALIGQFMGSIKRGAKEGSANNPAVLG